MIDVGTMLGSVQVPKQILPTGTLLLSKPQRGQVEEDGASRWEQVQAGKKDWERFVR